MQGVGSRRVEGKISSRMCAKATQWSGPILVAVAGAAISGAAPQEVSSDNVVYERQQDMNAIATAAKRINAIFKGTSPYDAKALKAAAVTIKAHPG